MMWLLKKLTPDFKTIADFRKDNKDAIKKVCKDSEGNWYFTKGEVPNSGR